MHENVFFLKLLFGSQIAENGKFSMESEHHACTLIVSHLSTNLAKMLSISHTDPHNNLQGNLGLLLALRSF